MRQAPMKMLIPVLPMLAATACVGAPPIVTAQSACSELLPEEWNEGVEGAALPADDTVGAWIAFGDAQTGQLDKSNDRYRAAIGIVGRCEKRDRAAVKAARPKFLGIF